MTGLFELIASPMKMVAPQFGGAASDRMSYAQFVESIATRPVLNGEVPPQRRDSDGGEVSDVSGLAGVSPAKVAEITARVEAFVRDVEVPYKQDPPRNNHDRSQDELIAELKGKARAAGVLVPHMVADGLYLSQRKIGIVLERTGFSPLGALVCKAAPDKCNMYLLGKVGSPEIKARFLQSMIERHAWSTFVMTESSAEGRWAGSKPCVRIDAANTQVREGYRFDERALAGRMAEHIGSFGGRLIVEQFKGGQSNPTYEQVTPKRSYVIRCKPSGQILRRLAAGGEAQMYLALGTASFLVTHVNGLFIDASVIGSWIFVTGTVAGRLLIPDANYAFYVTFNFFRLAAIFHGIKGRVIRGTAASAHAKKRAASLPSLIDLALLSMRVMR